MIMIVLACVLITGGLTICAAVADHIPAAAAARLMRPLTGRGKEPRT